MTRSSDTSADEPGLIAWLETKLRNQSPWIEGALFVGLPLCAAGMLLGVTTIAVGVSSGVWNFLTRGVGLCTMSVVLALALAALRDVRSAGSGSALSAMIALASARACRTLSLIRAGLCACVIAAVFGLAGTAIRTHLDRPPRLSPLVDLAAVALVALALWLCRRQIRLELGKYRALSQRYPGLDVG